MKNLTLIMMILISSTFYGATKTTIASGNWNNPSIWSGGIPGNNDNAVINHTVILNQNDRLTNITINGTLINSGYQLRVDGDWVNNGTYTDFSGKILFRTNTNHQLRGNTTFYNLEININTNKTVYIMDNVIVNNILNLTKGDLDINTGTLRLYSDEYNSGRIGESPNGNIIGSFIFEKWVDRCNDWSLYGGPFDATLNEYADSATGKMIYTGFPNSDFPTFGWTPNTYLWDEDHIGTGGWIIPDGNVTLPRGTGFWYWNSDTVFNSSNPPIIQQWKIATKGSINFNSTFNFPIQYTNSGDITSDGWNLVSNPYPGVIDWDNPGFTKTNVDNAIYVFNTCNQNYSSYVGGVGVNGGTNLISTSQGFYVKARGTSPILRSSQSVIVDNNTNLLKTTNLLENVLRINFKDDEIVIRENDLADESFNSDFDAYKFIDNAKIYSKNYGDTTMYSINSVGLTTPSIPIYVKGGGTLYFTGISTWEPQYDLYLEDILLNTFTSLNSITSYTFTEPINVVLTNRFRVHFNNPLITNIIDNDNKKRVTLIKTLNILGQEVGDEYNGIRVEIYSDGSTIKKINKNKKQ